MAKAEAGNGGPPRGFTQATAKGGIGQQSREDAGERGHSTRRVAERVLAIAPPAADTTTARPQLIASATVSPNGSGRVLA